MDMSRIEPDTYIFGNYSSPSQVNFLFCLLSHRGIIPTGPPLQCLNEVKLHKSIQLSSTLRNVRSKCDNQLQSLTHPLDTQFSLIFSGSDVHFHGYII